MKRDIKINYGKIEEIISNIIKYDGALNDMEASLNCIKAEINNSTGESIDSLLNNYELLIKNIGICKEELNDLRKILSDYINEMGTYAQPIDRGSLIRVDRNDVWWNIKSMEGIINQITDEQMRWGYNYSGSWSSDKDVIRREEHNARQIDSINHIVEKYVNKLNGKIQEIYAIHNSKVIPFENTDDAFRDKAWNMYWKCTGLGDWVGDFFGFLDKSFNNIIDGVLKGLTDLVVGLVQLAIGAVEYVGSCAVVVLCEPFGGAPDWIKNKVDSGNELISSILKDPALIIEGIAQDASDAIDEKGICYSAGYLGGTFLGTKGLDKIAKGVKGLISGTETGTIKTLEQGATQALKSIKDILNKAGNKSIEQLDRIITKVYSRVNGVLDVEVAGYGRIRIRESSILDDVDKICKDRYAKWAEGKLSDGMGKAVEKVKVPTVKSGEFNDWFNSLSIDELDSMWRNKSTRKAIERQLRAPGGMHEWHLVSRAPEFKNWKVSAEQIRDLRTSISDVEFVNPVGKHGQLGSTKAHNELLDIIDSSIDYDMFKRRLNNWANYRLKGGVDSLPKGLRLK